MLETHDFVSGEVEQKLGMLGDYLNLNAVRERYENYKGVAKDVDREFFFDIITLMLWMQRISNVNRTTLH
jgi:hypothetical protein